MMSSMRAGGARWPRSARRAVEVLGGEPPTDEAGTWSESLKERVVAILPDTQSTLIDEILDMHDRMIGSAFAKAKRSYETSFQEAGKAIKEKVRLYAKVGRALIRAKEAGNDAFMAIEQILSWEQFTASVREAEKLARSEDFDYLGILGDHYPQPRRYLPAFLEAFEFKAAPAAQSIIEAIDVLKKLPAAKSRSLLDNAPTEFIRRRWTPYVFTSSGLDRRYYELCVVTIGLLPENWRRRNRKPDLWSATVGEAMQHQFKNCAVPGRGDSSGSRQFAGHEVPGSDQAGGGKFVLVQVRTVHERDHAVQK